MTPAQAISSLDSQLAEHGETIGWQITANGVPATATNHKAFVRGYKPDELIGGINQGDSNVIMSPTGLSGLPKKGDKLTIAGAIKNIQSIEFIRVADVLVRIECQMRG